MSAAVEEGKGTADTKREETSALSKADDNDDDESFDPLLREASSVVREGDFVLLVFGDGRQVFAQCLKSWKGKSPPVKINKRSYRTTNLVGLPYGTVLELGLSGLNPLPPDQDILPEYPVISQTFGDKSGDGTETGNGNSSDTPVVATSAEDEEATAEDSTFPAVAEEVNDNRDLVDTNTSQGIDHLEIQRLRRSGTEGSAIVGKLIENSATFDKKTEFSKAKYVARKQKKYQPRCRMVRCTASTICEALFLKDPRKLMNMREDTLGQILSFSNISAGCQALVMETCMGVVTGAVAERMGGYGKVLSIYSGQQPAYLEMLQRFNLSFAENHSIKWLHSGDVFAEDVVTPGLPDAQDPDKAEREGLSWPCPLQEHTRSYLENMGTQKEKTEFLAKRCARFARKLTRHTQMEAKEMLLARPCDSIIIVARYDPTATLLALLPYLANSGPFVVYCEFIEPLTVCFREIQRQSLAINLRLSDTWMREYQILPGRTHPNMTISQSGGFLLTGIKLCPETGHNELDDSLLKEIRGQMCGRRGRRPKHKNGNENSKNGNRGRKNKGVASPGGTREAKRLRKEDESY